MGFSKLIKGWIFEENGLFNEEWTKNLSNFFSIL